MPQNRSQHLQLCCEYEVNLVCCMSCFCSDAPVSELSLELLLLQVVLPALLEQGHTRQWLKRLVHAWTFTAGYVLYAQDAHTAHRHTCSFNDI